MKNRCLTTLMLLAIAGFVLPSSAHAKDRAQFQVVEATIADIQAAFRSGALSPEELVQMYLARIAKFDQAAKQPLNGGTGQQPFNSFMRVNSHAVDDDDGEGD